MTKESTYQALVVDDDAIARKMLVFSLGQEGFKCDTAADGVHAGKLAREHDYDLIITDLRMPNKHGHSLSVELLQADNPPVIMVHTSLNEPKLTKDLLERGVDDIVYKPANYAAVAAKAHVLVKRRRRVDAKSETDAVLQQCNGGADVAASRHIGADLDRRLLGVSKLLPLSQSALDTYRVTIADETDAEQIAAAIACDASLAAELLQLGNSSYYNPSSEKVDDLERIVVRIGRRRVGELALAASSWAVMGNDAMPWLNMQLMWKRSIAAGVAMDLLLQAGPHKNVERGLFLSAVMHPLGRVALAMTYAQEHQLLVEQCEISGDWLSAAEVYVFGKTHSEILAQVLAGWNVPPEIVYPLHHALSHFQSLRILPEPHRTRAELVKLAILIGRVAVGEWMPWDLVEFPPDSLIKRLGIESLGNVVDQVRTDTQSIVDSRTQRQPANRGSSAATSCPTVRYRNASHARFDFLAELAPSLGIDISAGNEPEDGEFCLINALGVDTIPTDEMDPRRWQKILIVTDDQTLGELSRDGSVLNLPNSHGRLREACQRLLQSSRPASPSHDSGSCSAN